MGGGSWSMASLSGSGRVQRANQTNPPTSARARRSGLEADLGDAIIAGRGRKVEAIAEQLATFIEVADAAFNKLALPQRSQVYIQARVLCVCVCAWGGCVLGRRPPFNVGHIPAGLAVPPARADSPSNHRPSPFMNTRLTAVHPYAGVPLPPV